MNNIEPGYRVGMFYLGKKENELKDIISGFNKKENERFIIYQNECTDLYISKKTEKLYEIVVHSNFIGSFEDIIQIGCKKEDIIRNYGECRIAFDDFYAITKYRDQDLYGLLLEFTDDTLKGKIAAIHIYDERFL